MDTFGEHEIMTARVRHNKKEGKLTLTTKKLVFSSLDGKIKIRIQFPDIKDQKINRPDVDKVLMKIETTSNKKGFVFSFLDEKKALQDRNLMKEALIQAREGTKKNDDIDKKYDVEKKTHIEKLAKERALLLASSEDSRKLFESQVKKGKLDEDVFWEGKQHNMDMFKVLGGRKAAPSTVTGDIRIASQPNVVRYYLTHSIIDRMFKEYPSLKETFDRNVPDKISEKQFWSSFFKSKYFHRNADDEMGLFSIAATRDDIAAAEKSAEAFRKKRNLNSRGAFRDEDLSQEYISQAGENETNTNLQQYIRRFNNHSEYVLANSGNVEEDGHESVDSSQKWREDEEGSQSMQLQLEIGSLREHFGQIAARDDRRILSISENDENVYDPVKGYIEEIVSWDPGKSEGFIEDILREATGKLRKKSNELMLIENDTAKHAVRGTEGENSDTEFVDSVYEYFLRTNELLRFFWSAHDNLAAEMRRGSESGTHDVNEVENLTRKLKRLVSALSEVYDELRQVSDSLPKSTRGRKSRYLSRLFHCIDSAIQAFDDMNASIN